MSSSGVVLIIAGAWVLCQVLGGNALGRLGVTNPVDLGLGDAPKSFGKGLIDGLATPI